MGETTSNINCRREDNIQKYVKEIVLEKQDRVVWTGFIWLRMGASGGLL
jgi:hypothetical protein